MMQSSTAIATGIEKLSLNGRSVDSAWWDLSRFTDGWMMTKAGPPSPPGRPVVFGGLWRVFILDDGDAHIINSSAPPNTFIESLSKATEKLGLWTESGYFDNVREYNPPSGESRSVPVVSGDRASYTAPVDGGDAAQAAILKAEELGWPAPDTTGYRFTDGWLFRADEDVSWWEPDSTIKRFVVLDHGAVHTEDGNQHGSDTIRKYSLAPPDNLKLWYPTGYINIRPDGTNHWIHTDQESPITVWAGPQHA